MKSLLLAMFLVPATLALAAEKAAPPSDDPMAGWVPPKVKNEAKDKQEIQAVMRAWDSAGKTGDLEAAAALVDFPVTMVTDDSKGEAMGEAWSREQWTKVMKPFYDKPMKDMKVTHKPTIFLLSDSLASVDDVCTMTQGGKTMTTRNSTLMVRRDGKWLVKAMAEGGWGDKMGATPRDTASGTSPAPPGSTGGAPEPMPSPGTEAEKTPAPGSTGTAPEPTPSPGTESGKSPAPGSTGTAPEPTPSPGTESGTQAPPERTTK